MSPFVKLMVGLSDLTIHTSARLIFEVVIARDTKQRHKRRAIKKRVEGKIFDLN
jgi:hypothetical protein